MSATNAHRLGANEAPPAIISIFTGSQLAKTLEDICASDGSDCLSLQSKSEYSLGLSQIPEILIDNTDRNRTSPFAFTGNRFEFRAVGSTANCASAMIALNAAVAEPSTRASICIFLVYISHFTSLRASSSTRVNTPVRRNISTDSVIRTAVRTMVDARKQANAIDDERTKAVAYHDNVAPQMEIIRYSIDKLELLEGDRAGQGHRCNCRTSL